jgi:hypothetical protein
MREQKKKKLDKDKVIDLVFTVFGIEIAVMIQLVLIVIFREFLRSL